MNAILDEEYFTWLYSQIGSVKLRNPSRTHWELARQLYSKEFIWLVPNDDNRVEDGKDLRYEFLDLYNIQDPDENWLQMGCSMLEMLIGLSRRLSFEADGEPREWFWQLMENIGLAEINDQNYNGHARIRIDDALDRVIWRTYSPSGRGGLFPLSNATENQQKVELWYQLSAYLAPDI